VSLRVPSRGRTGIQISATVLDVKEGKGSQEVQLKGKAGVEKNTKVRASRPRVKTLLLSKVNLGEKKKKMYQRKAITVGYNNRIKTAERRPTDFDIIK